MSNNNRFIKFPLLKSTLLTLTFAFATVVSAANIGGNYAVSAYDKDAGDATLSFQLPTTGKDSGNSDYSASLSYSPSTLADFFGGEPYRETVAGAFVDGAYLPAQHQQTFSGSDKQINTTYSAKLITYDDGSESREFSVENTVYDTLSLILQVREDAKNNSAKPSYYWMTEDNIRGYDALFSNDGEISKVVLTQQNSGKRVITIEFDKDFNLLLFHKVKSGKVQFSLAKV